LQFHAGVSKLRVFNKYWLPVALWMAVIFAGSTGAMSPENTSRIIGPILRFIYPQVSDATIGAVQFLVRKSAHATEYAVLGLLLWRARRKPTRGDARPWNWAEARFAWLVAVAYAASDEWHQSFVPSRMGQAGDVLIDAAGAAAALLMLWCLHRRFSKPPRQPCSSIPCCP
jgi:VanZ family protein